MKPNFPVLIFLVFIFVKSSFSIDFLIGANSQNCIIFGVNYSKYSTQLFLPKGKIALQLDNYDNSYSLNYEPDSEIPYLILLSRNQGANQVSESINVMHNMIIGYGATEYNDYSSMTHHFGPGYSLSFVFPVLSQSLNLQFSSQLDVAYTKSLRYEFYNDSTQSIRVSNNERMEFAFKPLVYLSMILSI